MWICKLYPIVSGVGPTLKRRFSPGVILVSTGTRDDGQSTLTIRLGDGESCNELMLTQPYQDAWCAGTLFLLCARDALTMSVN